MIRKATGADFDSVMEMGAKFYAQTTYAEFAGYDISAAAILFDMMLCDGVLLVAEEAFTGILVGVIGLIVTPFHFNHSHKSAHEVLFWVDPDRRGSMHGYSLLAAVDGACREAGAGLVQMLKLSTSPAIVDEMYERLGYVHSESAYTKVL